MLYSNCIIATSVDVERVFSRARRMATWERNRLSPQSMRALMCLGYWFDAGLVEDDIVAKIVARNYGDIEDLSAVDIEFPADYCQIRF